MRVLVLDVLGERIKSNGAWRRHTEKVGNHWSIDYIVYMHVHTDLIKQQKALELSVTGKKETNSRTFSLRVVLYFEQVSIAILQLKSTV